MITILCAMQAEADAVIEALGLVAVDALPWASGLPARVWDGEVEGVGVRVVSNGFDPRTGASLIGTTPATLTTQLVIEYLKPRVLVVAGAAGGCSRGTKIGQTFLIEQAFHHDRRIPLPEFVEYAHGPEALLCPAGLGLPTAKISTGNGLDTLEHELGFFAERGVTVKDMETASVAWTASLYGTKVMAIRSITDFYDHPGPEDQFLANFDLALGNLASEVKRVIPGIDSWLAGEG